MLKVNSIHVSGNLCADPQYKEMEKGPMAKLRLAVAHPWKRDESYYIDALAWRKAADLVEQFCVKGTLVFIEGYLEIRTWTNKDGVDVTTPQIVIDRIQFVDRLKPRDEAPAAPAPDTSDCPF
jgi:single-strand DNA-binding protein